MLLLRFFHQALSRLRPQICGCALVCLFTQNVLASGETEVTPNEQSRQAIAACIEKLGAPEYRERERAEQELQKYGLLAWEQLEGARTHEDIEIRLRARFLVAAIRGQMIAEFVRPELREMMEGYERKDERGRAASLNRLLQTDSSEDLPLLARIARFEESERLAREAALAVAVANWDEGEGATDRKTIRSALGFNQRPPVKWIRASLKRFEDPRAAIADFDELIEEEELLLISSGGKTSRSIVERLKKLQIDLLLVDGQKEAALNRMASLDLGDDADTIRLNIDWMLERAGGPTVIELAKATPQPFAEDAILRYRLAEAHDQAGNTDKANKIANEAFLLAGAGLKMHTRSLGGLVASLQGLLIQDIDPVAAHLAMAIVLEDDRGRFHWAEREYRAALLTPPKTDVDVSAYELLALMLHDQQRDQEAADVLDQLLTQAKDSPRVRLLMAAENETEGTSVEDRLRSQMHFYRGLALASSSPEKAAEEYQRALDNMRRNPDLLIAMYRLPNASEDFQARTKTAIEEVVAEIREDLENAELQMGQAVDERTRQLGESLLAIHQNEFAWLIGNTFGDIDRAIRYSEQSLAISPGHVGRQDTLARCYYRKGNLDRALYYQRQAAESAPHELQIVRQLELFEAEAEQRRNDTPAPDAANSAS